MTKREKLIYLIDGLVLNTYDIVTFTDQFVDIYYHEQDDDSLKENDKELFDNIAAKSARFSSFDDDFKKYPNAFFTENDVRNEVKNTHALLGDMIDLKALT